MPQVSSITWDGGRRPRLSTAAVDEEIDGFQLVAPPFVERCLGEVCGDFILLEAHFSSADHPLTDAEQGSCHIPGALQMHPSYLEAGLDRAKYYPNYEHPSEGNLLLDQELAHALENLGIAPDTLVVVYGTEPDGTMAAARLVWALLYAGVRTVRLLDGGIRAWLAHGGETTSMIELAGTRTAPSRPKAKWSVRSQLLATTEEVAEQSKNNGMATRKIVDVRERGEWDGSNPDHYPFFSKAGHIPTAEYQGDWKNLVNLGSDEIGPMLDEVEQLWRELGIIDPQVEAGHTALVFYCGTGWRSSIAVLVALLLGLRTKNYDDGFYGWSWDANNEIVTDPRS